MQERRKQSRILFHRDINILLPDGDELNSIAHDFSINGMGILANRELEAGQTVFINFKILSQGVWNGIDLRGRVIFSQKENGNYKTGVSFF